MSKTKIEWADEVWNPVWGCLNDCPYCYAKGIARRFGKTDEQIKFKPTWIENNFQHKFAKSTKRVFVNSMSDVMYWRKEWWDKVLDKIGQYPDIDFIFLTKGVYETYPYQTYSNCVFGWTQDNPNRIGNVLSPTRTLINIEPILQPIIDKYAISNAASYDWVIIGALTGKDAAKYKPEWGWYGQIVIDCINNGVAVFIKPSLKDITPPEFYLQQFLGRKA